MLRRTAQILKRACRIVALGEFATREFSGTVRYWEERYQRNGTSGLGSYGPLARMKADFVNTYIRRHGIRSVMDFGVGDGNQLRLFDVEKYVGVDVSETAIARLRQRFRDDATKRFVLCNGAPIRSDTSLSADLALSLDVIYHLVEDAAYERYLDDLFHCAREHVIIYSSDVDRRNRLSVHVRDRNFTARVKERFPGWELAEVRRNPLGLISRSDFFVYRRVRDGSRVNGHASGVLAGASQPCERVG